jgi:HEAT repeat protein
MRILFMAGVVALTSGCGRPETVTAGGKPVAYWLEAVHSPDARLRKQAVTKLGHVGPEDPATLPALMDALRDPDAEVRRAAVAALASFGAAARDAIPALNDLRRNDRSARVRDDAGRALAALGAS